jgi:hypothetical protein
MHVHAHTSLMEYQRNIPPGPYKSFGTGTTTFIYGLDGASQSNHRAENLGRKIL